VAAVRRLRRVRTFRQRGDEQGSAALIIMLAMLVVVVAFMAGANLVVFEYGQGTVRTAVDEAARAGSQQLAPGGPIGACQAKAAEVMANLLPGPFGRGVTITCTQSGNDVVATATGRFPGWLPPIPALSVHIHGASHLEQNPT
jgi:flagellar basal body-associated protein FliL